jgi:Tol biopolymer transport system component
MRTGIRILVVRAAVLLLAAWPLTLQAADGAVQLTFDGSSTAPGWSPDGARIAHMKPSGPNGEFEIWTIPGLGGAPTQLTLSPPALASPDYAPDGRAVVCASSPPATLWTVPAGGGTAVPISDGPADAEPDWSPDGTQIAFSSYRGGRSSVWVMPAAGGPATQLTSGPRSGENGPAWSPDGSHIAFVSLRAGLGGGIAVMPAGGGAVTLLTDSPLALSDTSPSWSPDGTWIVFSRYSTGTFNDLWMVPVGGGPALQITGEIGKHDIDPAWSPDGSTIAFTSDRSGAWEIWSIPAVPPVSVRAESWGAIKGKYRE